MSNSLVSKLAIAIAALLLLLSAGCLLSACSGREVTPLSDDKLIVIFKAHRNEVERLRIMATEDMHTASVFSQSNISTRLPASRRNEYGRLLKISPGLEIGANYDGSVRFVFDHAGRAIGSGWAKGLQFRPIGAKLIGTRIDSLDGAAKLTAGTYLREIDPEWFVFYQRDE